MWAAIALLLILFAPASARAADVDFFIPSGSLDPKIWEEDPDLVARRSILKDLMARTHLTWTVRPVIGTRAHDEVNRAADVCDGQISRMTAGEWGLAWFPLYATHYVFLARAGAPITMRRIEDAAAYRVGAALGSRADKFLAAAAVPAQLVPRDLMNYQKLLLNRIDLWFTTEDIMKMAKDDMEQKLSTVFRYQRMEIGIACNPSLPRYQFEQLEAAAKGFRRDHAADWGTTD